MEVKPFLLLNAVAANGDGSAVNFEGRVARRFTVIIKASSVTTGATLKTQGFFPLINAWADLDSRTIGANGDTVIQFDGPIMGLRGSVANRTDGTFSMEAHALF